jgi:hypothetical protein
LHISYFRRRWIGRWGSGGLLIANTLLLLK